MDKYIFQFRNFCKGINNIEVKKYFHSLKTGFHLIYLKPCANFQHICVKFNKLKYEKIITHFNFISASKLVTNTNL